MNYFINVSMVWLIKWDPLSLINVLGQPNHIIMFSYMNFVATSFVQDSTGSPSSDLVTYSIDVITYLDLILRPDFGKGPKSL